MVPLVSLLLLTLGVQKIRRFDNWDRKVRRRFQRLGSIPKQISDTIRQLENDRLDMDMQELGLNLPETVRNEVLVPERQLNPKTLEHMLLRAIYLHNVIADWSDRRARFYDFFTVYQRQYGHIKSQFKKTSTAVERYFRLKFEIEQASASRSPHSRGGEGAAYRKSLTELRADVRHELKNLLDSLYTFIACAVHSEAISKKARLNYLREIGFILPNKVKSSIILLDPNDLTVLILFTVFVIPLTAALANFIGGGFLAGNAFKIFMIWTPMAVVAGLSSVAFALAAKQCSEQSDHPFWQRIRSGRGRPWFCYILGATAALFISSGIYSLEVFMHGFRFPLTAALLLGGAIGAILPTRFRERFSGASRLTLSKMDLKEILKSCLRPFEAQARTKHVSLSIAAGDDLPQIDIDSARVMQAVRGLVSNALENTQEGGEIVVRAHLTPAGAVRLSVRDNGIGMNQEILSSATATLTRYGGIILGELNGGKDANLVQIQAIAQLHGGRFGIDSEHRSGTEVWIEFPHCPNCTAPPVDQFQPARAAMGQI